MNILILGNGFDIAHGLPTRYTDFLKFCRDNGDGDVVSEDESVKREFSELIKDNVWLSYFLRNTPNLDEEKTWIDFEVEIRSAIVNICKKAFEANKKGVYVSGINEEIETIKKEEHFGKFVCFENRKLSYNVSEWYKALRDFTRAFEIYCCGKAISEAATANFILNKDMLLMNFNEVKVETYVVSFNYTRTFEQLYDTKQPRDDKVDFNYVFIHGEASIGYAHLSKDEESPELHGLVLGTHSFDRTAEDKNIPIEFNVFQKHNQQHKYSTLADYQSLLKKLRDCHEPVYIFVIGHSLDKSDYAKLKHLFCENRTADITVYYHDEVSLEKYITNITEILGEEDVAARLKFRHQHGSTFGILRKMENEGYDE